MYLKKIPKILDYVFPKALWRVDHSQSIFLTFDDGPDPISTPILLSLLDEYNIKASFFCNGEKAEKYPQLIKEIKSHGHYIGNHGYHHISGWSTSTDNYIDNAEEANAIIQSKAYRPPYGRMTYNQYRSINKKYKIVLWDVMPGDFDQKVDHQKLLNMLITHTKAGSIIVLHDSLHAVNKFALIVENYADKISQDNLKIESINTILSA